MVVTPYDIAYNKVVEGINNHGSCGAGFGTTIERNEKFVHLYAQDLKNKHVFDIRMESVIEYYNSKVAGFDVDSKLRYYDLVEEEMVLWEESNDWYSRWINIMTPDFYKYPHICFEGSQGIMLDQHLGFFPHVTRSNTTALNALEIMHKKSLKLPNIHYVVRAYMTRHGNGPFSDKTIELINNDTETNILNDWQGNFRVAPMDFDLLRYAINMNNDIVNKYFSPIKSILHVSCCDQLEDGKAWMTALKPTFMKLPVDKLWFKFQRDWQHEISLEKIEL
jgi:adenylosuccinate synthase